MKILLADDIRRWDKYTIEHEPITAIHLMERAAGNCVEWLLKFYPSESSYSVICGQGNNGGDGLAIARLLIENGRQVKVAVLQSTDKSSEDFQANLKALRNYPQANLNFIKAEEQLPDLKKEEIIIDALFGSGLNRPLTGIAARLVEYINQSGCKIVAVDIPSGLFADRSSLGNAIVRATQTLSFQAYKLALLVAENADYLGKVSILDIGLTSNFYNELNVELELIDMPLVHSIYKPRGDFGHKGNFGHALIIAGSYGKMGAALMSASSCLRSGVGLLSCHIPSAGYSIMQTYLPEAMALTDFNTSFFTKIDGDLTKYKSIGIGPGLGTAKETRSALRELITQYQRPIVLDADALNCLATEKSILAAIPEKSILSPHPKEFERMFGKSENDFDRMKLAIEKAQELKVVIILKGHYTLIATPNGRGYFNSTGNAGMATGGSGDVLTGILTGLLAQGYPSEQAAILGVYLHGKAGDLAAKKLSKEAMIATDIISNMGRAFLSIADL